MERYQQQKNIGVAHIFNNISFTNSKTERHGSTKDAKEMSCMLETFGFKTETHTDETLSSFNKILDGIAASKKLSKQSSLIMVFLSHGDGTHINMKDGRFFIDDILQKFRGNVCEALLGKPKIFVFQACQGSKTDTAVEANVIKTDASPSEEEKLLPCKNIGSNREVEEGHGITTLPAGSDFLICNSTCQGYVSYRDENAGSWYIQTLIEVFRDYYEGRISTDYDITRLMTVVSKKVAEKEFIPESGQQSLRPNSDPSNTSVPERKRKQMPAYTSSMTKLFYLPYDQAASISSQPNCCAKLSKTM